MTPALWIKNTRLSLMERYNPSLFNLALNRSAEIKLALDAVRKMLPAVELEESEFLQKREKLLAFVRNTQVVARKWRETSKHSPHFLG